MGNRHTYTSEFKSEAVAYALSSGQPRYKIAESLGVSNGSLSAWIKDAERNQQPGALKVHWAVLGASCGNDHLGEPAKCFVSPDSMS